MFSTLPNSLSRRFVAVLCGILILHGCGSEPQEQPDAPEPATYSQIAATPSVQGTSRAARVRFTDITANAGIRFVHESGYTEEKLLPTTMGSGGGFWDYDGDGHLDVFLVNSRRFDSTGAVGDPAVQALYRNDGSGRFLDATRGSGLDLSMYGMGFTTADYDADGDQDIFLTSVLDGNRLMRNDGGRFLDATAAAGLTSPTWTDSEGREHTFWSTSAAFLDYDNDGWLDLFVCNYVEWSVENDIFTTRAGLGKSFTIPDLYKGQTCLLYRNQGDGGFQVVTEEAGLLNAAGKSLGLAVDDFNADGHVDVAVSNDGQPNFLYLNQGDGTFLDVALQAGIAYDESGRTRAGMGIDIGRPFEQGKPTIAIGNFSREAISLYTQVTEDFYVDAAGRAGASRATLLPLTFGLAFFDYDLDGWVDLALANGHIEPDIEAVENGVTYRQAPTLLRNLEGQKFSDATSEAGPDFGIPMIGRGLAYGDIDGDGDLDLLLTENGGPPRLLRNDNASETSHWIRFSLRGQPPNVDAIGARVTVKIGGRTQSQMVRSGSSYLSQSERTLTFGTGEFTAVESILIQWPMGLKQEISGGEALALGIDKTHVLGEPPVTTHDN